MKPRTMMKNVFQIISAIIRSAIAPRAMASQAIRNEKCRAQIRRNQPKRLQFRRRNRKCARIASPSPSLCNANETWTDAKKMIRTHIAKR